MNRAIPFLLFLVFVCMLCACSNSELSANNVVGEDEGVENELHFFSKDSVEMADTSSVEVDSLEESSSVANDSLEVSSSVADDSLEVSSSSVENDSLEESSSSDADENLCALENLLGKSFISDDFEKYPYADLPRFVIKTEDDAPIVDRETKVPATMKLLDEGKCSAVEMKLTIKGRGNSSWTDMPKKSYKLEFQDKESFFGFPKNRDWALIANYADRSLMRNYLVYNLSASLSMQYSPRCEFVEVFLNGEYLGVYLLTETVKVAKNRVNIPENEKSFLVEVDGRSRDGEVNVSSKMNKPFTVHSPKNPSKQSLDLFIDYINEFEDYLQDEKKLKEDVFDNWLDKDAYLAYYWIQELSKNNDASFYTSVYFTWSVGGKITMGPVWDFDLSFGNFFKQDRQDPEGFFIRYAYWNSYLFNDSSFVSESKKYWEKHRDVFLTMADSVESLKQRLELAAANNFKRWDILGSTRETCLIKKYNSYKDAVDDLRSWFVKRYDWINKNY